MERKKTFKELCADVCRAKSDLIMQLQKATGANTSTVYRWVGGFTTPSARDKERIAESLGSTVEELFGNEK